VQGWHASEKNILCGQVTAAEYERLQLLNDIDEAKPGGKDAWRRQRRWATSPLFILPANAG